MKQWTLLAIFAIGNSLAQGTTQTVVPFGLENQKGSGPSDLFLGGETQDLFRASYLATKWTTPVEITGLVFRVTGGNSFDAVIPSIEIRGSTSARVPESMSQVYS